MPPQGAIKVEGIPELKAKLRKIEGGTRDLGRSHKAVAARVAPWISALTPIGASGELAGAWRPGGTQKAATIRNKLPYAGPIEWGWPARGIRGAYATERAIRGHEAEIAQLYELEIAELVERHSGGSGPFP